MLELASKSYVKVAPLFEGIDHNVPLVYSVIEGNSTGRIFVDCLDAPSAALVVTDVGYDYVGGRPDVEGFNVALGPLFFDSLLPERAEKELILFAFSEAWRDRLSALLALYGAIVIHRNVFRFDPARFAVHAGWRARIPEGLRIRAIDAALVEAYPEYQPIVLPGEKRFGVCLMRGDEILSRCMAVAVGGGEVEIDIETAEAHQGRGYGFLTACAFIDESLNRGLTPSWACWPYRTASRALAVKLGFEPLPDVPAHFWAETM